MRDPTNDRFMLVRTCGELEVCNFNSLYSGYCEPSITVKTMVSLLPGDECPDTFYGQSEYRCAYGPKLCEKGVCVGYKEGGKCLHIMDCDPGYYCSQGNCTIAKKASEECKSSIECERGSRCAFVEDSFTIGKCVEYGSLQEGSQAMNRLRAETRKDPPFLESMLCASGYASLITGKCQKAPVIKLESGDSSGECFGDETTCTSDIPGVYAKCGCWYGGSSKCGILRGDEEGKVETAEFQSFIKETKGCHRAYEDT